MRNLNASIMFAGAVLGLLSLTSCDQMDPLTKSYAWHPTDINRANIAVMAANPNDLIEGRDSAKHSAVLDTLGINHILLGKPVALPDASATGGSSASGGASGAAPGGGN